MIIHMPGVPWTAGGVLPKAEPGTRDIKQGDKEEVRCFVVTRRDTLLTGAVRSQLYCATRYQLTMKVQPGQEL